MSASKVLVVEDDPVAADYIRRGLERAGRAVDIVHDGQAALHMVDTRRFDAIVLDRMLPKVSGLTILEVIRGSGSKTPVLILSAISSVGERVRGLQHGADDYMVKPFHISELVARIDVILQRSGGRDESPQALSCEDLHLNLVTRMMTRGHSRIRLQDREFGILRCLMEQRGKPVARAALLKSIWNYDFDPGTNIVDVHISRLRAKLDATGEPGLIKSVRGIGYRIGRAEK